MLSDVWFGKFLILPRTVVTPGDVVYGPKSVVWASTPVLVDDIVG